MNRPSTVLPWIVAFKAFKAAALTTVGIALLVTRHADPVGLAIRFGLMFHLPLASKAFARVVMLASGLTVARQVGLGITALAYAALMAAEGIGLYLRRRWARWFTIVATGSVIPVEVYEIARAMHAVRVLVLLANVGVVLYLVRCRDILAQ